MHSYVARSRELLAILFIRSYLIRWMVFPGGRMSHSEQWARYTLHLEPSVSTFLRKKLIPISVSTWINGIVIHTT